VSLHIEVKRVKGDEGAALAMLREYAERTGEVVTSTCVSNGYAVAYLNGNDGSAKGPQQHLEHHITGRLSMVPQVADVIARGKKGFLDGLFT